MATAFVDETVRRHAVSRTQNGGPLATTVGIPMLTAIAAALTWRGAFVILSGLALATALLLWRMLFQDEAPGRGLVPLTSLLAAYRPLVRQRVSLTYMVAACLEQASVWVMWTYYGAFYVQQHALTTQQVGEVSLAARLGVLLSQTVAGGSVTIQKPLFLWGVSAPGRSSVCRCCFHCRHSPPLPAWPPGG